MPGQGSTSASSGAPATTLRAVWLLLVVAATAVLVTGRVVEIPAIAPLAASGGLTVLLTIGVVYRTGGRPILPTIAALLLIAATLIWEPPPLLAAGAVAVGTLSAVLAVMATEPARTFVGSLRELAVVLVISVIGALAVAGFEATVSVVRFGYVVLGLSLVGVLLLVFRLGAGLHGLGRRGMFVAGFAVLLLFAALAYGEALANWGPVGFIGIVDEVRDGMRQALGAVPHPIEALLGVPAVVWGTFMRARRRQGWWVCGFGVAATASMTLHLIDGVGMRQTLLSGLYTVIVGVAVGYLAIRLDVAMTGTHGARARRSEEASAARPEPTRLHPLV